MAHSAEEVKKHIRVYITVFISLAILTVVTVAISYLEMATPYAIALGLTVASIKAFLVAAYFMHLVSENKVIHSILWLTGFFFLVLLILPQLK